MRPYKSLQKLTSDEIEAHILDPENNPLPERCQEQFICPIKKVSSILLDKLSIDDMLAQDELLEALGIGFAECSFGAQELCDALKQEDFSRRNRFMLLVPFSIGQVRFVTIGDDMLAEHARAWCDARRSID